MRDNLHVEGERIRQWMATDQRGEPMSLTATVIGLVICVFLLAAIAYGVEVARAWGLLR